MKFTKAANMGLHVMVYFAQKDQIDSNLSIHDLADKFEVSPSYLSKILTQLAKANLISSVSGVKGGYRLKKNSVEISFWMSFMQSMAFPMKSAVWLTISIVAQSVKLSTRVKIKCGNILTR